MMYKPQLYTTIITKLNKVTKVIAIGDTGGRGRCGGRPCVLKLRTEPAAAHNSGVIGGVPIIPIPTDEVHHQLHNDISGVIQR